MTTSGIAYEVHSPHSVAIVAFYLFYCSPPPNKSAHSQLNQVMVLVAPAGGGVEVSAFFH